MRIAGREIGPGVRVYIVAEMSANHNQDFHQAVEIASAAKECGADAVKLQTYTADTMTIDCQNQYFRVGPGTIWEGKNLYQLYREAHTPWEWQPKLKEIAERLGLALFSTPFDDTSVDFLEEMQVPAYKIASFEIVDLPLLRKVAATRKPVILSTGMATLEEIREAVDTLRREGTTELALLKCTSAYPATAEEMNLRTLSALSKTFDVPVGLSDHSLSNAAPVAAVTLGACIIEKHLTLSRSVPGPDSGFSLEPTEFRQMVAAVRETEKALGQVYFGASQREHSSRAFRRSLFVVEDIRAGDAFTERNVRSIRPSYGLHTRYWEQIRGRRASTDIPRGTPLSWLLVAKPSLEAARTEQQSGRTPAVRDSAHLR